MKELFAGQNQTSDGNGNDRDHHDRTCTTNQSGAVAQGTSGESQAKQLEPNTSHSNVGMSVSMETNNTCTARVEHVTEITDNPSSGISQDTCASVNIECSCETINTLEDSEGEVVLRETIFCRQVNMRTYIDFAEQQAIACHNTSQVDDDAGPENSDQIRMLHSDSDGPSSHQLMVRVSAEASGKTGESPNNEKIGMPTTKGVYILGYVEGVGCSICVDTGCTKTTISERLLQDTHRAMT